MKNKRIYLLGIGAVSLTFFLYLIDSDPPYAEFGQTAIDFLIMSGLFFALFLICYFVIKAVMKGIKPWQHT